MSEGNRVVGMEDVMPPEVMCGGCGAEAPVGTEGWRFTDAEWCPKCAWLA